MYIKTFQSFTAVTKSSVFDMDEFLYVADGDYELFNFLISRAGSNIIFVSQQKRFRFLLSYDKNSCKLCLKKCTHNYFMILIATQFRGLYIFYFKTRPHWVFLIYFENPFFVLTYQGYNKGLFLITSSIALDYGL